ncbi:hypothetical protein D3C72_2176210 [compost metagenome]
MAFLLIPPTKRHQQQGSASPARDFLDNGPEQQTDQRTIATRAHHEQVGRAVIDLVKDARGRVIILAHNDLDGRWRSVLVRARRKEGSEP